MTDTEKAVREALEGVGITIRSIISDAQGASVCGEPEMGLEMIYYKASGAIIDFDHAITALLSELDAVRAELDQANKAIEALNICIKQDDERLSTVEAERDRMSRLVDRLRQEAEIHSMEARGANSTVREIYQIISGGKGEPGNWNGAEPVRRYVAAVEAERDRLRVALDRGGEPIAWRWRDNEHQTWNFIGENPIHLDYVFVEPLYAALPEIFQELTSDEAWEELCNADDRTSPAEYPDHALITRDELADFMARAALSPELESNHGK